MEGIDFVFSRAQLLYVWMAGIFLTSLIVANLIGSMLFSFSLPFDLPGFGHEVLLSAGIIPFPVTFILTDLLNEFYGKRGAQRITFLGFGMSILVYLYLWLGQKLPVDSISQLTQPQFLHFSQLYTHMFVASLTAYLLGQLLDIQIFHVFRRWTGDRLLWLRATGSTVIAQLFDSIVVTVIAFGGSLSMIKMFQLAVSNYSWKFLIVVAITPLLYFGRSVIKAYLGPQSE